MENIVELEVNVDGIIDAIRVVSIFNKPMQGLVVKFETYLPSGIDARGKVADGVGTGRTFFEALAAEAPELADACHDFVYQIALPLRSITEREIAKEKVVKIVLGLV
jgi:hypothetical protein